MELVYFLIALPVTLLCILLLGRKRRHPKYPPGPTGLPLIGNIHQMGKKPSVAFLKWKIEYGNIFSIKLGLDDAVVINDPKLVKELFNDPVSAGRLQNHAVSAFSGGNYGILNIEGEAWEEQRRFALRKLRELGFAKSSIEGLIQEEAKSVVNWFRKNKDTPISCARVFNAAVVNTLWGIVSGERSEWNDEDGKESDILRNSDEFFRSFQRTQKTGVLFVPFLKYVIPEFSGWNQLLKACQGLHSICDQSVTRHRADLNPDSPQDLIDHYLIEMDKTTRKESSFFEDNGMKNLKAVVVELFFAGNETTSATLSWAMLYLSYHTGVQQKLRKEIKKAVGTSRPPSLEDKLILPYTQAVIMEVLRKSTFMPIAVPHRCIEDKMFQGYFLPKHTVLIMNMDSAHNDPEYWGDPENFRPDRFLSEDGTKVVRNEALLAFSTGKRQCLGKTLAEDTLFLFISSIFQRFEVVPEHQNILPDLESEGGIVNIPKPFKIIVKELAYY